MIINKRIFIRLTTFYLHSRGGSYKLKTMEVKMKEKKLIDTEGDII